MVNEIVHASWASFEEIRSYLQIAGENFRLIYATTRPHIVALDQLRTIFSQYFLKKS